MKRFQQFVLAASHLEFSVICENSDIRKFFWRLSRWGIAVVMPFYKEFRWYENMAEPSIALWAFIALLYITCAFFCFLDLSKLFLFFRAGILFMINIFKKW